MTTDPVLVSDLESFWYFWTQRGDVTRDCNWETLQPALEREHPEIPAAYRAYKAACTTLTAVLSHALQEKRGDGRE